MIQFEEETTQDAIGAETMTPMIDVILSLIAFMMLMINAPMLTMEVELPDIDQPQVESIAEEKSINLQILAENQKWRIDHELVKTEKQLKLQLTSLVIDAKKPVATILTIDKKVPAQRMIETLDILNRLNIKNINIALDKKSNTQ